MKENLDMPTRVLLKLARSTKAGDIQKENTKRIVELLENIDIPKGQEVLQLLDTQYLSDSLLLRIIHDYSHP